MELLCECDSYPRAIVFAPALPLPLSPGRGAQSFVFQSANSRTIVFKAWEQWETLTFFFLAQVKCTSPFHLLPKSAHSCLIIHFPILPKAGLHQSFRV